MADEILENETPTNDGEEQPSESSTETETPTQEETLTPEEIAELKKKAELAENYKTRAEKAEKKLKQTPALKEEKIEITPKDYLALSENKITSENFDEVLNWARFKRVTVSEALKDKTLQTVLRDKESEMKSAAITNTRGTRGFKTETPEDIVSRAIKGEVGESDEDIQKLVEAEHAIKMRKVQK